MDFVSQKARVENAMLNSMMPGKAAADRTGLDNAMVGGEVAKHRGSVLARLDVLEKQLFDVSADVAGTYAKITGDSVEWGHAGAVERIRSGEIDEKLSRIESLVEKMAAVIARTNMSV